MEKHVVREPVLREALETVDGSLPSTAVHCRLHCPSPGPRPGGVCRVQVGCRGRAGEPAEGRAPRHPSAVRVSSAWQPAGPAQAGPGSLPRNHRSVTHTHRHTHARAHTHTATHMHTHTCAHIHMHTHTHTCAHMHTDAHTYVHRCTHIRTYVCAHTLILPANLMLSVSVSLVPTQAPQNGAISWSPRMYP